jgi:peptide/nickel transport system permease protein
MRFTDVFLAFPAVLLAMSVSAALGPSLLNAALAIGLVWWPGFARLVRGEFLSLRERTYVEAARALGATDARLIFRHLLPNTYSAVMVKTTVDVGYAIVLAAGLSFVGLGAQPPQPEWGAMVTTGRTFLIGYWWVSTFPGLAILLAVLGFSLAGDTLRDVLDPRWLRT